eukprot:jgi/Hompol1/7086/HPOL_005198-RA
MTLDAAQLKQSIQMHKRGMAKKNAPNKTEDEEFENEKRSMWLPAILMFMVVALVGSSLIDLVSRRK